MLKKFCLFFFLGLLIGCSGLENLETVDLSFYVNVPKINEVVTDYSRVVKESKNFKLVLNMLSDDESLNQCVEKDVVEGQRVEVAFKEIPIKSVVWLEGSILDESGVELFFGKSDSVVISSGKNQMELLMQKIVFVDALEPKINIQPIGSVQVKVDDNEFYDFSLAVNAESTDEGELSFVWQEKKDNGWVDFVATCATAKIENSSSYINTVNVSLKENSNKTLRCAVTNNNENVNGKKSSTIFSDEVTIAYVEGVLKSFEVGYKEDAYQLLGEDFNYGNVVVTETYDVDGKDFVVAVTASEKKYKIFTNLQESGNCIGYVPYMIEYIGDFDLQDTDESFRVPVKCGLENFTLLINGTESLEEAKIAAKVEQLYLEPSLSVGENRLSVYKTEDSTEPEGYNIEDDIGYFWNAGTFIETNGKEALKSVILVDNEISKEYVVTIKPKVNAWCIGQKSNSCKVEVCEWRIVVKDGKGVIEITNIEPFTTYTLKCENDALGPNDSVDILFSINGELTDNSQITTPYSGFNDRILNVKAMWGSSELASINLIVKGDSTKGTSSSPIEEWDTLKEAVARKIDEIYIDGTLIANSKIDIDYDCHIINNLNGSTILTDENFNAECIFNVSGGNLTLKGDSWYPIEIKDVERNVPNIFNLINISENKKLTMENVNINNCNYNCSGIFVEKGSIKLNNCSFENNNLATVITIQNSTEDNIINNCKFVSNDNSNTVGNYDLYITTANKFTISSTNFEEKQNVINVKVQKCDELVLQGDVEIPLLHFMNINKSDDLNINVNEFGTNGSVKIKMTNYEEDYDLQLITVDEGCFVPEGITLDNSNYKLNEKGKVVRENGIVAG